MDFHGSSYKKGTTLFIIIFYLLFINCAEIGPPPGGEEDKAAPYLIFSYPSNGATEVPTDNKIELHFSERIVKPPKTQKAIFISPRPQETPEIKWKADRVVIIMPDSFNTDQTYIITLGNAIKDLRRNSLDSTSVIAFSTGKFIDSGLITGQIFDNDKPGANLNIGLYSMDAFDNGILKDSIYPEYMAQSNRHGKFRFEFLPKKIYMMIAFEDKDQNELFNLDKEKFAVPDRMIDLIENEYIDNINLSMTGEDTTTVKIISASFTNNRLVKLIFSKDVSPELISETPLALNLINISDSSKKYRSSTFLESYMDYTNLLHFYVEAVDTGMYNLELIIEDKLLTFENFTVVLKEDKELPTISTQYPDNKVHFKDDFQLETYFSEPIDTAIITNETFSLWDNNNERIPLISTWLNRFHVLFEPEVKYQSGKYHFNVTEFEISDLDGNVMGDSLTEYRFSVINKDSIGVISGQIIIELKNKADDPVILSFTNYRNRQVFDLPVDNKQFKIELPAGKYLLTGYIDSNNNSKRDLGSLSPYMYSETYTRYTDTIAVRARFETSEINFIVK